MESAFPRRRFKKSAWSDHAYRWGRSSKNGMRRPKSLLLVFAENIILLTPSECHYLQHRVYIESFMF